MARATCFYGSITIVSTVSLVIRSMSRLARSQSEVFGEIRKELYDDHEFRLVSHVFVIMGASVSNAESHRINTTLYL